MEIETGGLSAGPTVRTTGMASPEGAPSRITTLTWRFPATIPAAEPAYCTSAGTPPIDTETCWTGFVNSVPSAGRIFPSAPNGFETPSPVAYRITTVPLAAGVDGL